MSLADKIREAEEKLIATKDALTDATKKLEDGSEDDADIAVVEELSDQIEKQQVSLAALKKAEQALASKAVPVGGQGNTAPAYVKHAGTNYKGNAADLLFKSALVELESGMRRVSPEQVMQERYPNNDEVKNVVGIISKAVQGPALTTAPSWAGDLVNQAVAGFMDLLLPESVFPKLSLKQFTFDGYGSIKIPKRNQVASPTLAGGFVGEASPIRIGAASIGSTILSEKKLGVIGTYSDEILRRATPQIESMIKDFMVSDTAEALDKAFLGAGAATAVAPAGMLNGVAGIASAGTSVANIITDVKALLGAMANLNLTKRPVWVMHPLRAISLQTAITATGSLAFPSMGSSVLYGFPVLISTNADPTIVMLVEQSQIASALGSVEFMYSYEASLHEEDTAPAALDGATPVRSLFQTHSHAIRMVMYLDYQKLHANAVGSLTGVAW